MTLRLPIPALAALGLQLGAACHHEDAIVGHWKIHELEGDPAPEGLSMSLAIDADLGGSLDYEISYGSYHYEYHNSLKVDASGAPTYIIDILPTDDIGATQLRCELAGSTLTCDDVGGAGIGDPVFKRG